MIELFDLLNRYELSDNKIKKEKLHKEILLFLKNEPNFEKNWQILFHRCLKKNILI